MMTAFNNDLENWMGLLPLELRSIPIINLAIPGSHDSMSYGIKRNASVAPDAHSIVSTLNRIMPCVVRRWAKTQYLIPTEQLRYGVRYFDLRICLEKSENNFYFVHGLFCELIQEPLNEIKQFLDDHPDEFIIFDCQHFYEFSFEDHKILANILLSIFGDRIYGTNNGTLRSLTLNMAKRLRKQILIVYRSDIYIPPQFWSSAWWPTPWPNQIKVSKLQDYLNASVQRRTPDIGYVSQCVLTPPVDFIIPRFYSTLRSTCAQRVRKQLFDWIKIQTPGPFNSGDSPTSNVFIADFIDLDDYEFCKIVVALNRKLLTIVSEKGDSNNNMN